MKCRCGLICLKLSAVVPSGIFLFLKAEKVFAFNCSHCSPFIFLFISNIDGDELVKSEQLTLHLNTFRLFQNITNDGDGVKKFFVLLFTLFTFGFYQ
jgi:hypothetical protein